MSARSAYRLQLGRHRDSSRGSLPLASCISRVGCVLLFGLSCQSSPSTSTSEQLGAGVLHHEIYSVEGPWSIHLIEIDLPTAWAAGLRLKVATSRTALAREKTSRLAAQAVAGINGDFFFASGGPLGLQVSNGEIRQEPSSRSAFVMTSDGTPSIDVFRLHAGLITGSGRSVEVAGLNRKTVGRRAVLYNHLSVAWKDSVEAEAGFQLQSLQSPVAVNDTVAARVLQVRRRSWPLRLDPNQWLVAVGSDGWAAQIAPGDTVQLFLRLHPSLGRVQEGISGGPRIVRDGIVSIEFERELLDYGFATDRRSRTAIGYTRDEKTLFLLTVDGGQPGYSVGMRLENLGRFMATQLEAFTAVEANAYQALNMDGGGSTTMVIGGEVVNRPSDPIGERPIGNALLLVDLAHSNRAGSNRRR